MLAYEAHGFFLSGGKIGTAGPDDVKDVTAVLDHLLYNRAEWNADPDNIALLGISFRRWYCGGRREPRFPDHVS